MNFTTAELELLNSAITMALQSNKRMLNSKPQFTEVFRQIENDYNALKFKINTPVKPNK